MSQTERQVMIGRVQAALDAMPDRIHAQNSFKVAEKLIRQADFQRAEMVGIFVGFGGEVDTIRLMDAALELGKRVAAPTVELSQHRLVWREVLDPGADIDLGPLGIPQPLARCREIDPSKLGLVTVPGIIWDERGRRLARWPAYLTASCGFRRACSKSDWPSRCRWSRTSPA